MNLPTNTDCPSDFDLALVALKAVARHLAPPGGLVTIHAKPVCRFEAAFRAVITIDGVSYPVVVS